MQNAFTNTTNNYITTNMTSLTMKYIVLTIIALSCLHVNAESYKGDTGFLSNQMAEWCIGESQHKNFCHGYLQGIYENTSCLYSRKSPDFEELKKVYVGWFYAKG